MPYGMGVGFFQVFMAVVTRTLAKSKAAVAAGGVAGFGVSLAADDVAREVWDMFPGSDADAIDDIQKLVRRLLRDKDIMHPINRMGALISPNYLTFDMMKGRGFFHGRLHTYKTDNAAFKRGRASGERQAKRDMAQEAVIERTGR
jgi:hypothetical protein